MYDGAFSRTWEFICDMHTHLEPILEYPSPQSLDLILMDLKPRVRLAEEDALAMEVYRRLYSSNVWGN